MRTVLGSLLCLFAAASPAFAQADIATDEGVTLTASFYRNGESTPFFTDTDSVLPEDMAVFSATVPGIPFTIGVRVANGDFAEFLDENRGAQIVFSLYHGAEESLILNAGDYEVVIGGLFPESGGQFTGFDSVRGVKMSDGTDLYPAAENFLGYSFDPVAGTLRFSLIADGLALSWATDAVGLIGNLTTTSPVPEPASAAALLGVAALGVGALRRRRR